MLYLNERQEYFALFLQLSRAKSYLQFKKLKIYIFWINKSSTYKRKTKPAYTKHLVHIRFNKTFLIPIWKKFDPFTIAKKRENSCRNYLTNPTGRGNNGEKGKEREKEKKCIENKNKKEKKRKEGKEWTNCLHLKRSEQLVSDR